MSSDINLEERKQGHVDLALSSQLGVEFIDQRFDYEPLLSAHPQSEDELALTFLDKQLKSPLWISSMTGGTEVAEKINKNLATVVAKHELGMGLGSCRPLLSAEGLKKYRKQFDLRPILGPTRPFYGNLGVAQVDQILHDGKQDLILNMLDRLDLDGLIVHVNPLQEWFQPGGDRFSRPAIESIQELLETMTLKVIVKEVGQGMGPQSLESLLRLPLEAIEFAAFGGTNFSKLELQRNTDPLFQAQKELMSVGHTAKEMVQLVNQARKHLGQKCLVSQFIISGGVNHFLNGHYLMERLESKAVIGQASAFLTEAYDIERLDRFVSSQVQGLRLARRFLKVRKE